MYTGLFPVSGENHFLPSAPQTFHNTIITTRDLQAALNKTVICCTMGPELSDLIPLSLIEVRMTFST